MFTLMSTHFYIHVYIHVYINVYTNVFTHPYTYLHTFTQIDTHAEESRTIFLDPIIVKYQVRKRKGI